MTAVRWRLRSGEYRDSGTLMRLAKRLQEIPGVTRAAALMATPRNLEALGSLRLVPEGDVAGWNARPADLLVVVEAGDVEAAENALERIDDLLVVKTTAAGGNALPRTLAAGVAARPEANLAVVSVPGPFAAREARRALDLGLHVFLFSNGVAVKDEIELKRIGAERGLLVMGPDCGTSILNGVPLGFANRVGRGGIGLVGASGTGLQEVTSLIDRLGAGVSHAIGTGGRDLTRDVGGASTLQALDLLGRDPDTRVIVVVGKPPAPEVADEVLHRARRTGKPVVACFLSRASSNLPPLEGVRCVPTLAGAARLAAALDGVEPVAQAFDENGIARDTRPRFARSQRLLRGLFSGGSLAYETLVLLAPEMSLTSNLHMAGVSAISSSAHQIVDLGAEEFTSGRPHPMIDPTLRIEAIREAGAAADVAVLLLDVVLGYGSHPDPAGALSDAIVDARRAHEARGGSLAVVASVTGTDRDPQDRRRQVATLERAGAVVAPSNAAAARLAGKLVPGSAL